VTNRKSQAAYDGLDQSPGTHPHDVMLAKSNSGWSIAADLATVRRRLPRSRKRFLHLRGTRRRAGEPARLGRPADELHPDFDSPLTEEYLGSCVLRHPDHSPSHRSPRVSTWSLCSWGAQEATPAMTEVHQHDASQLEFQPVISGFFYL